MYEILTGKEFKKAVKQIPIKSAICKYSKGKYEIWEISDEDFNELDSYIDKYDYFEEGQNPKVWKDEWGWWRWSSGSNIQSNETAYMKINNKNILMYFNPYCYDNYIEDTSVMIKLLPSIDRPPYDVIALDDYILSGAQLRYLHSQANNGHGKVIYTTQMNDIY